MLSTAAVLEKKGITLLRVNVKLIDFFLYKSSD